MRISLAEAQVFLPAPDMQMARVGPAVVAFDDAVVAVGGENIEGPLRSAEMLGVADDHWSLFGVMRVPRVRHTATLLGEGQILVAGGGGSHRDARLAELWNGRDFVSAGRMLAARNRHAATLLPDGRVLVTGGRDARDRLIADAEIWDPAHHSWHPAGRLRHPRCCHTATALPDGRVLVVAGLVSAECAVDEKPPCFVSTASVEIWDPGTSRFSDAPGLPDEEDRASHTATLLQDGRVLVAGGAAHSDPDLQRHDQLWDHGKWTPTNDSLLRAYHTATLLPNGRVLAIGGWHDICGCCKKPPRKSNEPPIASVDNAKLFDPATSRWMLTAGSPAFRARHGAALRPDGTVVVVGGSDTQWGQSNHYFHSAEVWQPVDIVPKN